MFYELNPNIDWSYILYHGKPYKVCWPFLSINKNATFIIEKNLDKVCWCKLSSNPNAIHIIEQNLDKVNWKYLSENPNAIHIIEQNLDKVIYKKPLWRNPSVIHILETMIGLYDHFVWSKLSQNPAAIHILEQHFTSDYKSFTRRGIIGLCRLEELQEHASIHRHENAVLLFPFGNSSCSHPSGPSATQIRQL